MPSELTAQAQTNDCNSILVLILFFLMLMRCQDLLIHNISTNYGNSTDNCVRLLCYCCSVLLVRTFLLVFFSWSIISAMCSVPSLPLSWTIHIFVGLHTHTRTQTLIESHILWFLMLLEILLKFMADCIF